MCSMQRWACTILSVSSNARARSASHVLRGDVFAEDCRDSYIASSGRLVTAIGLDGHVVVETDDAVLVLASDSAQGVKALVDTLKAESRAEIRGTSDQADAED